MGVPGPPPCLRQLFRLNLPFRTLNYSKFKKLSEIYLPLAFRIKNGTFQILGQKCNFDAALTNLFPLPVETLNLISALTIHFKSGAYLDPYSLFIP